ncbi:FAD-binding oxidoreductase [uncultured Traorella sp.]|uniref:FAD-binding oxidoreductase n=1 Tax=uncultured Traorella sp. TaxID=1929048 RepID=UPI0025F09410|nr:FAD-binding oxidoreductase [uncultured Traorella sp.]
MKPYKKVDEKDLEVLRSFVSEDRIFVNDDIHPDYSHDEMMIYGKRKPEVVIQIKNAQEAAKIMKYASEKNIAVTPRGAGTGLCGGCVPLEGGIVVNTSLMNHILEIDPDTMSVTLEPGVLLMEVQEAVKNAGFLYAPDPGEKSATVGGNVMTNAGGMRAVKYGVTRDYVRGMQVVTPEGEILELGGKVAKNSSGYSLLHLMIGSEGTLGIVTRITMKILPSPKKMTSLLIPFDSLSAALKTVPEIMKLPDVATTIEFMEKEVLDDAQEYLGKEFPNRNYPAYLIVSYSGNSQAQIESMLDRASETAMKNKALDVFLSDTEERQEAIWNARGAFLEAIKNSTTEMDECDVVLNLDKVVEFVEYTRECSKKYHVRIRSFGHAGDGNLHVYICKDDMDDATWTRVVHEVMDGFYAKARELNGQVSGEHGIGHAKKKYLEESVGETQIQLMRKIKQVFDPRFILNPGKIVD